MGAPVIAGAAVKLAVKTKLGKRLPKILLVAAVVGVLAIGSLLMAGSVALAVMWPGGVGGGPDQDISVPGDDHGGGALPPTMEGDWTVPVGGPYSLTSYFGPRYVDGCGYCSTNHQGVDLSQGCGGQILAAGPGTVVTAGTYYGYGNAVLIDHGDGSVTLYGHMQWGSLSVGVGDTVEGGAPLGKEGNTGNSFGCHLHFEVRVNAVAIDPIPFMSDRGIDL